MLNFSSWVAKICGRCRQHWLMMIETKGFFAEVAMLVRVDVGDVTLFTRDEVEEFVFVVRRIEEVCVEVESQDEEGWDFSGEPSLFL